MNRYRILREISGGGMGIVYEGRMLFPLAQELPVAIKIIRAECCEDAKGVEMFAREALTSLRINHEHPNLVTTHDFGLSSGSRPYMVMELIDGTSLREIAKMGRLPFEHIRRIAWDMLHGLAHLHKHGVLHRDVSPGNILVSRQGTVKLADFGLVKPADSSQSERFRGTTAYASPEALQGERLGESSDLYSLGVVLYELITGNRPYGSGGPDAIVRRMTSGAPAPLPEGTPPDLVTLIAGIIEVDPKARRFKSAQEALGFLGAADEDLAEDAELGDLVEAWIRTQPGESKWRGLAHTQRSLGNGPVYGPKPKRRRWMLASVAAMLALAVTGLVLFLGPAGDAPVPDALLPAQPCAVAESPEDGARALKEPAQVDNAVELDSVTQRGNPAEVGSTAEVGHVAENAELPSTPARPQRKRSKRRTHAKPAESDIPAPKPIFYHVPRVERAPWHIYEADDDKESHKP